MGTLQYRPLGIARAPGMPNHFVMRFDAPGALSFILTAAQLVDLCSTGGPVAAADEEGAELLREARMAVAIADLYERGGRADVEPDARGARPCLRVVREGDFK